jgi:hypothetical protein
MNMNKFIIYFLFIILIFTIVIIVINLPLWLLIIVFLSVFKILKYEFKKNTKRI